MAHAIDGSIDLMAKIEPHRTRGVAHKASRPKCEALRFPAAQR